MDDITPASLENQYKDLMAKVERIKPSLDLLYRDYLLTTSKDVKFTYAVDFHEIWSFAEPLTQSVYRNRRKAEPKPKVNEYIQIKQFARAELFFVPDNSASRVVLLPPYVVELNNKIAHVKKMILVDGSKTHDDSMRKLMKIANNDKKIQEAMLVYKKDNQIQLALLSEVQRLLEVEVRNLLFFISEIASDGISIIQDLLLGDNPSIEMASAKWPEFNSFIQQTMEKPLSEWNSRFREARPSLESGASNEYDSKAIDIVLALNEHLIKEGELVVIVSDAPTMERVLKKYNANTDDKSLNYISSETDGTCVQVPGFDFLIPIYRPVEMFYYLTILKATNDLGTLDNIKSELLRIDQLSILGEAIKKILTPCASCANVDGTMACSFGDGCRNKDIQRQLSGHSDYFDKYTKVLLAENRFATLSPAWEKFSARRDEFIKRLGEGTFKLIEYLSFPQEELEKRFEAKRQALQNIMEAEQLKALTLITDLASAMHQGDIGSSLKKITRTRYRVQFEDAEISSLLNDLEKSRYELDARGTLQIIKKLINRAYKKNIDPQSPSRTDLEKLLLWAILLLCHRLEGQAIDLVNRILPDVQQKYKSEYLYVRALAYFLKKNFDRAIDECKIGIDLYKADPRYYHLCGLAISKKLPNAPEDFNYSWSNAIDYTLTAYELAARESKDSNLFGVVVNNLAYFYYCRNVNDDLERALHFVNELKQLVPFDELERTPEFLNTVGCVFKELAIKEKNNEYAIHGLENLKRAYELAKDTMVDQSEIDEYEKDLRDAEQQIKDIIPLSKE